MRIAVNWANQYLTKPLSTKKMAAALEGAGLEVESIDLARSIDNGVVAGQVVAINPHPRADKLVLVIVDVGKTTLSIVCGAKNVERGQKVAVAQVGSRLPDGSQIARATIRSQDSEGMICSESELGLGSDQEGIMVLPTDAAVGNSINKLLPAEDVIETTTAANRWDLRGLVHAVREISAQSDSKMSFKSPEQIDGSKPSLKVKIAKTSLVPRYMLAKLRVNNRKASPNWLRTRLISSGLRPINLVVDITNYVMLETAQPLHAFDAAKVKGGVTVRSAKSGEKLTTLDGISRRPTANDLVIADEQQALGLAGVMGGQGSEVSLSTTEILLESASFDATTTRKTALRFGLRTEASSRFERGIPVESQPLALARAVRLLEELADADLVAGPSDYLGRKSKQATVQSSTRSINQLLGLKLNSGDIQKLLTRLDFKVKLNGDHLVVEVPWWRPDIQNAEDITEEVIKLVGYEQLPASLPAWRPRSISFDKIWANKWKAKAVLRSSGLFEVVSYSFISEAQIKELGWEPSDCLKLANPLSREQAYLRPQLLPSLLDVVSKNRGYAKQFGVFEFAKVYHKTKTGLPREPLMLGVMVLAEKDAYIQAKAVVDRLSREFGVPVSVEPEVFDAKVAHPSRSGVLLTGERQVGVFSQIHPALAGQHKLHGELGYLEIDWAEFLSASQTKIYRPSSRFPAIARDVSIEVERTVAWQQVAHILSDYELEFLNDYYGPTLPKEKKALAFRLTFSDPDRTLTDKEADELQSKAIKKLERKLKIKVRD